MKPIAVLAALMVLALGSGCSPKTTHTREKITPSSYADYQSNVNRSVGLLRRLLVVPLRYTVIHILDRKPKIDASLSTLMLEGAIGFLRDWKGYEIIQYSKIQDKGGKGAPQAQSQPDPELKPIYEWAENSEVDSSPPAEVKNLVSDLSRRFGADGVLVLQGFHKAARPLLVASAILTIGLAMPIALLDAKWEAKAHLYEASSGRIVWRCRLNLLDKNGQFTRADVERLLGSLENAAPAALINK